MNAATRTQGGRWAVTVGWFLGVVVAGLASAAPARAQAEEKLPKAEEVLDKAVDALGGKAAMDKVHNRVSKGAFEVPLQGMKGAVTMYEAAPNKTYTIIELPNIGKMESGTDGETFWEISPQGARILEGEEKAMKARESEFHFLLNWKKLYKSAECTGVADVADHPAFKIVLTPTTGDPQTYYFDRKTYLPVRMDVVVKSQMGAVPVEVLITDYKAVNGVQIPHKITQRMMGMEQFVKIDSVECNVDLPADRFALPPAVKELMQKPKTESAPAGAEKPKTEQPKTE
ncbi:MAG: hypothetical protein KA383_15265 [Phycisphaerae bacterium]|nr:hypothetical protein [Phycisphaerae bacterium]